MCGFAGEFRMKGLAASPGERLRRLRAMGQQLARRGPDDEQFYDDGLLSLVFRRLSIIDLEGGRQPIWNEDHTILTTVNGEIYNHGEIRRRLQGRHTFASQSDSEVVVHLFEDLGSSLMPELNGMFALLVWDTRQRRLLLARDRLGIKPLFYAWLGDSLIFASELKALLAHPDCPRELDWRDIEQGSGQPGHIPSFIHGVHHLPGGHYLMIENGGTPDPRAYWSIRDHFPEPGAAALPNADHYVDPYIERYGELLEDSVQKYLMSDVPVGLFLSGGIDSSLLAALAAKAQGQLHCFTVVEDSIIESGDADQAAKVTAELGLPHYPVRYDVRTVLDELDFDLAKFEYLIWAVETPRFRLEWLLKHELHRFSKTRIPDLKVMLLGQGADEFAGGYSRSAGRESASWQAYVDRIERQDLDSRRLKAGIPPYLLEALADGYPTSPDARGLAPYHRHMLKRISVLQGYNLWHEDRTSASQGVEARVPFLDHRLVELLASVPASLHEALFFDKHIVRRQLAKSLPSYPPDKLKVKLYINTAKGSIEKLRTDLVRRIFPEFRDKYLYQDGAVFSAEQLTGFYQEIIGGNASTDDLLAFFDCMAIQVFARMCETIPVTGPPMGVNPPSPLALWQAGALA